MKAHSELLNNKTCFADIVSNIVLIKLSMEWMQNVILYCY